jgi:hypothetical protein
MQYEKLLSKIRCGVIEDKDIESYLQGLEYDKWKKGKDLESTEEIVIGQDEYGNDIAEIRPVNIYEPVDVSEQLVQWKLDNYVLLRKYRYAPMEQQLDMQYNDSINGTTTWLDHCEEVKKAIPKSLENIKEII